MVLVVGLVMLIRTLVQAEAEAEAVVVVEVAPMAMAGMVGWEVMVVMVALEAMQGREEMVELDLVVHCILRQVR